MKKTIILALAVLLLLAATSVTFAMTTATTTVTISAAGIGDEAASIKTLSDVDADIKLKHSSGNETPYLNKAPYWRPVVGQTGSVKAGDLYYISTANYHGNVLVKLFLTNTDELSKDYSYLNLKVSVWTGGSDNWEQANQADGSNLKPFYLTLSGADYSFILTGNNEYCITIEDGNYFCIDTDAAGGSLSPEYFIDTQPL